MTTGPRAVRRLIAHYLRHEPLRREAGRAAVLTLALAVAGGLIAVLPYKPFYAARAYRGGVQVMVALAWLVTALLPTLVALIAPLVSPPRDDLLTLANVAPADQTRAAALCVLYRLRYLGVVLVGLAPALILGTLRLVSLWSMVARPAFLYCPLSCQLVPRWYTGWGRPFVTAATYLNLRRSVLWQIGLRLLHELLTGLMPWWFELWSLLELWIGSVGALCIIGAFLGPRRQGVALGIAVWTALALLCIMTLQGIDSLITLIILISPPILALVLAARHSPP